MDREQLFDKICYMTNLFTFSCVELLGDLTKRFVTSMWICFVIGEILLPIAMAQMSEDEAKTLISDVINRILLIIQYLGGLFAMVVFTYAGILWMRAGHEPGLKERAKSVLEMAIIGTILLIIGPALASWVFSGFLPV